MRNKKAKALRKQAAEIASRLPRVTYQCASGGTREFKEHNGQMRLVFVPHRYTHDGNHVRCIKRAFVRNGMEGVTKYLESIHKLQKENHAKISEESNQPA